MTEHSPPLGEGGPKLHYPNINNPIPPLGARGQPIFFPNSTASNCQISCNIVTNPNTLTIRTVTL
ncbi:MAG TPA: hypothetical protein VK175_06185 [Leadbetterella sp.]|nr:hypothetical protein [Leadbetterella sp.]